MTGHDRERKIHDRAAHQQQEETAGSATEEGKMGSPGHLWRKGAAVRMEFNKKKGSLKVNNSIIKLCCMYLTENI